ncbi:MAG: HlyD family efflux transporter periplasmic adaptor subunit [Magnetospirillum sp.]|nr:HlyD family efflux transporter periplasmic adaptor subunit [Magnetospirillum sp.]
MAAAWASLRDELSLHPGPAGGDGWPSWILRDPVRNRFFRIDWPGFEILARWSLGDPLRIAKAVNAETTLTVEPEDVAAMAEMLSRGHLLRAGDARATAMLVQAAQAERPSAFQWLLHHYLFFRVPLVRPDRFLGATAHLVGWLAGRPFRLATIAALLVGLTLLARQWDRFAATLLDTFTLSGAATYAIALVLAKVAHELSHAYTAKRLGCRVPTMGVAFLVLWPVLYTDVNDAWLLPRRRDRLAVGAAGVAAELTLAAWATLAWGLLDDGLARQAAFVLATTTWISSLLINLSPFMRFDGYFLAMDALNLPNLHPRSFALARWRLRELLFGLGEEPPEHFPPATRRGLTAFAVAVWLYRLVLFLGIAVLVYHFFIKLVGIVLFVVEIGWFVLRPVWVELREWRARGPALLHGRRGKLSLMLAAAALAAAFVPWPTAVTAPALLQAEQHVPLYPPVPAQLEAVLVGNGQVVAAGEVLFRLGSPDVAQRRAQAERRILVLQQELGASGFDPALQRRTQSLREELQAALAEKLTAEREIERLTVAAPTAGRVADLAPDIKPGQWLSPKDKLASVLGGGQAALVAYVSEDAIDRLSEEASARFVPTAPGRPSLAATVTAIERTAIRHLDAAPLASLAGGPIAVRSAERALVPEQALYRVRLRVQAPPPAAELIGTVHLEAAGHSLFAGLWRRVTGLLVREAGM